MMAIRHDAPSSYVNVFQGCPFQRKHDVRHQGLGASACNAEIIKVDPDKVSRFANGELTHTLAKGFSARLRSGFIQHPAKPFALRYRRIQHHPLELLHAQMVLQKTSVFQEIDLDLTITA